MGNPDICGYVSFVNGESAGNAKVVIGRKGAVGTIDTTYAQSLGDFYLCFRTVSFDTVYCDRDGAFTFDTVSPGEYVIVASKDSMLGMVAVSHSYYEVSQANVFLERAARMTIEPYFDTDSNSANRFLVANVAGTVISATPDSAGVFTFNMLPSGDLDIVLYNSNGGYEEAGSVTIFPGCSASIAVDPLLGSDYWTVKDCGYRDPLGRPYVIWSSPEMGASGEDVKSSGSDYDLVLQFSHSMDTRNTGNAISAVSGDSLTSIDTLWWQGSDMIYIALCTKDSTGNYSREVSPFRSGVTCSIAIDTMAQTVLGVKFAHKEVISFNP